jgi:chromosome segregation ATPase
VSDVQAAAITEILTWLEQQVREAREDHAAALAQVDQLQRQVLDLQDQIDGLQEGVRSIDPKIAPYKGLPEKVAGMSESAEHVRQEVLSNKAELDNIIRLLRAEAQYDREERAEAFKRIEQATAQLGLVLADVAQLQAQMTQTAHDSSTVLERQREIEAMVVQFGLRLDRSIEVHRDLEERILEQITGDQEERFDVVFERLQVVGEMVKRNEDLIERVSNERSMREELIHEIRIVRDQQSRVDERLNALEEVTDRLLSMVDKVQGAIALVEGRHTGLAERVAGIRRDIAEIVDHVREEFAKYNQMIEKQRRKQIQVLEQELREMKFHALHPPEEP